MIPDSRIRSYVLRQTRLTRLQQESYVRLSPRYSIPYQPEICDFRREFLARLGVEYESIVLEIGFGMGEATIEIARYKPDTGFIGVEVHKPGVGKVLSEIERHDLRNLLVIHHDVVPVLKSMIARSTLGGAHVFFPDPWPKKKHHKRRLIQPRFARLLAARLARAGYVYAVTDWEDYAFQMRDVLDGLHGVRNPYGGYARAIPWRPQTSFERKGREKNHPIFELYYEKQA